VLRTRFWKLAVLGWSLTQPRFVCAGPPSTGEPAPLPLSAAASPNQDMANRIARQINESGQLHCYRIDVAFQDGVVELTGTVVDQPQREEALRLVQGVPGVVVVRDRLTLAGAVAQAQAADAPPRLPAPLPGPAAPGGQVLPPPLPGPAGQPPFFGRAPNGTPEPTPIFQGPTPGPFDMGPPRMPPYAWPTYAPYNNYSRVGYPLNYPYQSFPFIGPCYPFPKIPPSWRSISLSWEDGHWWYAPHTTQRDFWHLRYW
jgi:hypothetical protein